MTRGPRRWQAWQLLSATRWPLLLDALIFSVKDNRIKHHRLKKWLLAGQRSGNNKQNDEAMQLQEHCSMSIRSTHLKPTAAAEIAVGNVKFEPLNSSLTSVTRANSSSQTPAIFDSKWS